MGFSWDLTPSGLYHAYKKDKQAEQEAWLRSLATPQERQLMAMQIKAMEQAYRDRSQTRNLILAQMGYKLSTTPGGKTELIAMSKEERAAVLSEADRARSQASEAYAGRAQAALKGETKLPSFLKQDIDIESEKQKAGLEEMMGPEFLNTTAGQQTLAELTKKTEAIRQNIQDQDIATTPGMSQDLSGQLLAKRQGRIGAYEALPRQQEGLISARGSILQEMQQRRLDQYLHELEKEERERSKYQSIFTVGGLLGGAAATKWGGKKEPTETTPSTFGGNYYSPGISYESGYTMPRTWQEGIY